MLHLQARRFNDSLLFGKKERKKEKRWNSNTRRSSNPRPLGYEVCAQPLCYQHYPVTDANQVPSLWTHITQSTEHHIRIRCICCKTQVPNVKCVYDRSHLHAIIRPHHFNFDVWFSCISAYCIIIKNLTCVYWRLNSDVKNDIGLGIWGQMLNKNS